MRDYLDTAMTGEPGPRGQRSVPSCRRMACLGLVTLVLAVHAGHAQTMAPAGRLMVVPFENEAGSVPVPWVSEAAAVLITDGLTALGQGAVSRDDRVRAFEQLRVPSLQTVSYATVIRIGALVGVSHVVVGSYAIVDDQLTVTARAVDLQFGRRVAEVRESGPVAQIVDLHDRVTRGLVQVLGGPVGAASRRPQPVAAFEHYIKGLIAPTPSLQIVSFTEALRLAPGDSRTRIGLWSAHAARGEHAQALAHVQTVPRDDPSWRQAQFLATLSMLELGQYTTAATLLEDLGRARTDSAIVNNRGIAAFREPRALPAASTHFAEAADLDLGDPDVFFNLGYALWFERDLPRAVEALREVVRLDPADGDAHFVLGVALQAMGIAVESARERELARQLSSTYAEWEARPGGTTTVPRGLERVKTDLDVPSFLRVNAAIVATGRREQQDQAVFHLEAGKRFLQAERDAEAINALRRAVYLAPYQSEAHLMLGRAYLRAGRHVDAVSALKISIWSADTTAARLTLAEVHVRLGDDDAARAEAQTVLQRDPDNVDAKRLIARLGAN